MRTIGESIRAARERAGLTLRDVAARMGVSCAWLCDVELGRRKPTRLGEIALAIGVTVDSLESDCAHVDRTLIRWLERNPRVVHRLRREMAKGGSGD